MKVEQYDEILKYLETSFTPYDSIDLISKLSSLKYFPQNGDHTIRLDAFLHVASSINQKHGRKITRGELNRIINSPKIRKSHITMAEDPRTQLLCEEISFFGGGFRIFPGIYDSIVFNITHTLKAIFLPYNKYISKELFIELSSIARFILELSELLATRLNIKRNTATTYYLDIFIPAREILETSSEALKITQNEFSSLLEKCGTDESRICWLITNIGQIALDTFSIEQCPLMESPILFTGEYYIITDPSSLLSSFMKRLLTIFTENNVLMNFRKAYQEAIWDTVVQRLDWMLIKKIDVLPHRVHKDIPVVDGVFNFEKDKMLVGILIVDDFENIEKDIVEVSLEKHKERLSVVSDILYSSTPAPNGILYLFITAHYVRTISYNVFIPPYNDQYIVLSADNLNIIAMLEGGKNNFLLKYAWAQDAIRKTTELIVFDQLSEYGFFKEHGYSYYIDDERRPTMMNITDDFARDVRLEALKKVDMHTVYNPLKKSYVQVVSLAGEEHPIYIPHYIPQKIEVILESYSLPIWFYNNDNNINGELRAILIEFMDLTTYWLHEVKPSLTISMNALKSYIDEIEVEICLEETGEWTQPKRENYSGNSNPLSIQYYYPNRFKFTFKPYANALLFGETNEGERTILRIILGGFCRMLEQHNIDSEYLIDTNVQLIIDKYAPLGKKKKLCTFDTSITPLLDPRELHKLRLNQKIDEDMLLDEIGNNIVLKKITVGSAKMEQVKFINNHIVGYLWGKLNNLLKRYTQQDILNYLLNQNEALIREKYLYEVQLPMRLSIANPDRVMKEYSDRYSRITNLGPAVRFLIECVVAQKNSGLKLFSDSDFDELAALSKEIVSWGFTSDLIYSDISDMKISLLPSGRIGRSRKDYDQAMKRFSQQVQELQINRLSNSFFKHWDTTISREQNHKESMELDKALYNEFGFDINDLAGALNLFDKISHTKKTPIVNISEDELLLIVRNENNVDENRFNKLLIYFTLFSRDDYFTYPGDNNPPKENFYPWRFTRKYSYIRRPILKCKDENEKVQYIYAVRHLHVSLDNFIALIISGRLQNEAKTDDFKSIIGKLAQPAGDAFNAKVAELFNNRRRYYVRKNVNSFGKIKIERTNKEELGDIDVIVIDWKSNKLILIECKDLLVAKTPYEVMMETKKVFEGDKSLMAKFIKRIEWVKNNLQVVLNYFELDTSIKWKVKSLFVVNEPLFSALLKNQSDTVQILTYHELEKKYKSQG